jgi:hypothetical protein
MFTLHRNTRIAICLGAAALAGCAKKENAAIDTSSAMASTTASTTMAAPAAINLADVAGKWDVRSVPTSGTDTSATTYVLTATNSTSGWTIKFPNRAAAIPVRVTVEADSIVMAAGPFESVRRKGVQVTTNGVARLQNGSLVGTTTAHYRTKAADSVLVLTTTGTRSK